jgi:hypothetical protein
MKTASRSSPSIRGSESGMITVDFLFAFVLVMGFGAILFALSMSLTAAEITQYVTFAAARSYMAGHLTPEAQREKAFQKYRAVLGNPVLQPLFVNGWFEVNGEPEIGDMTRVYPEYAQPGATPNNFWGVGTRFTARMLEFQIPFYGSTASDGDGQGSGFVTFLASYLGREVTTAECMKFVAQRWQAIRKIPVPTGFASHSTGTPENGYVVYDDNGC